MFATLEGLLAPLWNFVDWFWASIVELLTLWSIL